MSLKVIDKNIASVAKLSTSLNSLIHETAVLIVEHCQGAGNGDCSRALALVNAMPKSARRGLLITWFARYSPIGVNVATGKYGLHKEGSSLYNPYDVEAGRATPFYAMPEVEKENLPDTLEGTNKMILSLVTRLENKVKNGEVKDTDIDGVRAKISALKAVAA